MAQLGKIEVPVKVVLVRGEPKRPWVAFVSLLSSYFIGAAWSMFLIAWVSEHVAGDAYPGYWDCFVGYLLMSMLVGVIRISTGSSIQNRKDIV